MRRFGYVTATAVYPETFVVIATGRLTRLNRSKFLSEWLATGRLLNETAEVV